MTDTYSLQMFVGFMFKMRPPGEKVIPPSSLLLRKASNGSCGAVGSKDCCSSSSSFTLSIALLHTASWAEISSSSFCILNWSSFFSCSAMTVEKLSFSCRATRLARQVIDVSLHELLLDPDLVEVRERDDFRE